MSKELPSIFANERALASAGSGKTYALTNRFIALSLMCDPASICALTFTRATAGEFFEKILLKLADASQNPDNAKVLASQLAELGAKKDLSESDFLELLKKIISRLPNLCLSTIDAFEMRLVSAFASELGMSSGVKILDNFAEEKLRADILGRMLRGMSTNDKVFGNFFEAISRANHGDSRSAVFKTLFDYVKLSHSFYCENPNINKWRGDANVLKPLVELRAWNADEYARLFAEYEESLPPEAKKARARHPLSTIRTFFANSSYCNIANVSTKPMQAIIEMLSNGVDFMRIDADSPECAQLKATPKHFELIYKMLSMVVGASLVATRDTAEAVGAILQAYDQFYIALARSRGALTFSDLPILLSSPAAEFERGLIEYRLDAKYKHWLLDEFQDTSRSQWRVISNLISENLQSADGSRTFYYVGDTKQSLYSWRGGDSRLFDEVFEEGNGNIRDAAALNVSWRSTTPIIDTVNTIFSSPALSEFNADAAARWNKVWGTHYSHKSKGDIGVSMILRRKETEERADAIFKILEKIRPWERGLSCAIIVQRNDLLLEIANGLRSIIRSQNLNVSVGAETDSGIAFDNMFVPAVLQLLRATAHPADTSACAYVAMTPLSFALEDNNWRLRVLNEIATSGFGDFIANLTDELQKRGFSANEFTLARASDLITAARKFDSSEYGDIDTFVNFVENYKLRESSKKSDIQLTTFHKSKGLDYDIVILPQNENARSASEALRIKKIQDGNSEMIVNMPSRNLAAFSTVLSKALDSIEADVAYEKICMFYVGLTRAKRALYFLLSPDFDKVGSKKYDFERHLFEVLLPNLQPCDFTENDAFLAFGSVDWYKNFSSSKKEESQMLRIPRLEKISELPILPEYATSPASVAQRFSVDFGTRIHSLLSRKSYFSVNDNFYELALAEGMSEHDATIADSLIKNALVNPEISKLFAESANTVILREYPYAIMEDNVQQSGVFDRVIAQLNADSSISSICVIDYKTNLARLDDATLLAEYKSQMDSYRRAIEKLYGLSPDKLSVKILNISGASLVSC